MKLKLCGAVLLTATTILAQTSSPPVPQKSNEQEKSKTSKAALNEHGQLAGTDASPSPKTSRADARHVVYLQGGGTHYAGTAHFYLAASLFSQALLTSPKFLPRAESLSQQARAEFRSARQLGYKPVESTLSPKVFGEWAQVGKQP